MSVNQNKVKFGLKNVHYAKLTETVVDGVTTYTYGTVKAWPGAVNISLSAEGDSNTFYADNYGYYVTVSNNGYTGDLESAIVPDDFLTDIMGEAADTQGVVVEKSDTDPAYFAMLFEIDGDQRARKYCFYKVKATRPNVESGTKEDSIEVKTDTISLTITPREDSIIKARTSKDTDATVYDGWYSAVYSPVFTQASQDQNP